MRTLNIGSKEYIIEFSFEAAEYKDCVDKAFKILSGAYLMKRSAAAEQDKASVAAAYVDGTADMVSDIPSVSMTFFYAGLLEHNPVEDEKAARALFKQFMKENPEDEKASFFGLYEFLKTCMEEDGFFKLTGLDKMIAQMNAAAAAQVERTSPSKSAKTPAARKKKAVSTM